jgi:hypothetical protein
LLPSLPEYRARFLEALASGLSVTAASQIVGVNRCTPYEWRNNDPEFAKAWDIAINVGTDLLEDEAWRRAYQGTDRPVYQNGALVGAVRDYSDNLLMFLLRGRRPQTYRDNAKVEMSGNLTLTALVEQAAQKRLERAKSLELTAELQ